MNQYGITILIWYFHNFCRSVTMATPIGKHFLYTYVRVSPERHSNVTTGSRAIIVAHSNMLTNYEPCCRLLQLRVYYSPNGSLQSLLYESFLLFVFLMLPTATPCGAFCFVCSSKLLYEFPWRLPG